MPNNQAPAQLSKVNITVSILCPPNRGPDWLNNFPINYRTDVENQILPHSKFYFIYVYYSTSTSLSLEENSFICSFIQKLLNAQYVLDTVLDVSIIAVNETKSLLTWILHSSNHSIKKCTVGNGMGLMEYYFK